MSFVFDPSIIKTPHHKEKKENEGSFVYKPDKPSLDTLVQDIYTYIGGKGNYPQLKDDAAIDLSNIISNIVVARLQERRKGFDPDREFLLRMSNYGTPDRKLWFEANIGTDLGATDPRAYLNFLLGDIWEAIVLFLAKQTGHKVEMEQETVYLDDMPGHMDAVIDDVLVDVKSTSAWSYKNKFMSGKIFQGEDSFGYIPQLKGYGKAAGIAKQAWLCANKENGELAVVKLPESINFDPEVRLKRAKEVITLSSPPIEKCYEPEPFQKSGNMQLNGNCKFCAFKELCWKDANGGQGLRAFDYSNGRVYLTEVVSEPKVPEIPLYQGDNEEEY